MSGGRFRGTYTGVGYFTPGRGSGTPRPTPTVSNHQRGLLPFRIRERPVTVVVTREVTRDPLRGPGTQTSGVFVEELRRSTRTWILYTPCTPGVRSLTYDVTWNGSRPRKTLTHPTKIKNVSGLRDSRISPTSDPDDLKGILFCTRIGNTVKSLEVSSKKPLLWHHSV